MLGFITGSLALPQSTDARHIDPSTPYGPASTAVLDVPFADRRALFVARHGTPRKYLPHEINYLANVWALKQAGAREILAICTVGGIDPGLAPGALVVPDQLIDYTWGRLGTYGGAANDAPPDHIVFSDPFDASLSAQVASSLDGIVTGGVYGCTQGPRLETAAEIRRMANDGCTLVGMTAMPEAALARELELPYAAVCLVVNPAAGVGEIEHADIARVGAEAQPRIQQLIDRLVRSR